MESAELIASYLEAFRACNKMSDPPDVSYERGWYLFKSPRTPLRRYRHDAIEEMRERLIARAKEEK